MNSLLENALDASSDWPSCDADAGWQPWERAFIEREAEDGAAFDIVLQPPQEGAEVDPRDVIGAVRLQMVRVELTSGDGVTQEISFRAFVPTRDCGEVRFTLPKWYAPQMKLLMAGKQVAAVEPCGRAVAA